MSDFLLNAVAEVTREAGRMAFAKWRGDFERWDKSPGNPVSEVDLAVDHFLRGELAKLDTEAGWLSEETADDAERLLRSRVWVVDPIDGTRDFIRGRPGWAISVALVEAGRPVLAILDAPARDEHWVASLGGGAVRNGQTLVASRCADWSGVRVPADALPRIDADLVMVDKPNSIALRMAMVAADEADLVASLRWGFEWDIVAAALIASEAGAKVTDAFGGKLHYNSTRGGAFGVLATAEPIHAQAVERLADRAKSAADRSN